MFVFLLFDTEGLELVIAGANIDYIDGAGFIDITTPGDEAISPEILP
jgi:hypothetical protein